MENVSAVVRLYSAMSVFVKCYVCICQYAGYVYICQYVRLVRCSRALQTWGQLVWRYLSALGLSIVVNT